MSLKRSIAFTFVAQLPTVLLGFLTGVLITRLLEAEGRGLYSYLYTDLVVLSLFFSLNLNLGMVYFLAKGEHPREKVIGVATGVLALLAIAIPVVYIIITMLFPSGSLLFPEGAEGRFFEVYLYLALLLAIAQSYFSAIFQGLKLFKVVNRMSVLSAVLTSILIACLFLFGEGGHGTHMLRPVLVTTLIAAGCIVLGWLVHYLVVVGVRPVFVVRGALVRQMVAFTGVAYLANLLNQLNYRLDVWILEDLRGPSELGLYAVAVGVAHFLFQVPEPMSKVLNPYMVAGRTEEMLMKFKMYSRLSFTTVLVAAILLAALSNFLFPVLYGEDFGASVLAFRLLLPGVLLACGTKILVLPIVSSGRVGFTLLATAIGLVVTVLLDLVLIPEWGLYGAAFASSVAYLAIFLVVCWSVFKKLGIPFGNYFLLMPGDLRALRRS